MSTVDGPTPAYAPNKHSKLYHLWTPQEAQAVEIIEIAVVGIYEINQASEIERTHRVKELQTLKEAINTGVATICNAACDTCRPLYERMRCKAKIKLVQDKTTGKYYLVEEHA